MDAQFLIFIKFFVYLAITYVALHFMSDRLCIKISPCVDSDSCRRSPIRYIDDSLKLYKYEKTMLSPNEIYALPDTVNVVDHADLLKQADTNNNRDAEKVIVTIFVLGILIFIIHFAISQNVHESALVALTIVVSIVLFPPFKATHAVDSNDVRKHIYKDRNTSELFRLKPVLV